MDHDDYTLDLADRYRAALRSLAADGGEWSPLYELIEEWLFDLVGEAPVLDRPLKDLE